MNLLLFITMYASMHNIDPLLVKAIIHVESGWNVEAIGSKGDIGLMQIRRTIVTPHRSVKELLNPIINVMEGVKHLKWTKKYCKHKKDFDWLSCYNMGVTRASKLKNPENFIYVKKVRKAYYEYKRKSTNHRSVLDTNIYGSLEGLN